MLGTPKRFNLIYKKKKTLRYFIEPIQKKIHEGE